MLVSYAAGHAVAAVGNGLELMYWRLHGGMPSTWVVGAHPRLLTPEQVAMLEARVKSRLGLSINSPRSMTGTSWFPISRQIYSDVERNGKPSRIETFNGNYGLNRGLCAALLALAVVNVVPSPTHWYVSIALIALAGVYLYRMHRFGVHYARELYSQFLLLPPEPGKPTKSKTKAREA